MNVGSKQPSYAGSIREMRQQILFTMIKLLPKLPSGIQARMYVIKHGGLRTGKDNYLSDKQATERDSICGPQKAPNDDAAANDQVVFGCGSEAWF